MKLKIFSVLLCVMLTVFSAFAEPVRIGALKGPTAMGLVKLMTDSDPQRYEFTLAGSADELTPAFLKGELDILAAPANLGAVLYAKTEGNVRFLGVNALGVLYILEKGGNSVQSVSDLRGRTVYAAGKGSTPEYVLRYILSANGLDPDRDVAIEWKSEAAETVAAVAQQDTAVAMLPMPYAAAAMKKTDGLRIALDLTEEWESADPEHPLVTAALITSTDFLAGHTDAVDTFLEDFAASAEWVNANTDEAAELCGEYGIADAAVAKEALPKCNIVCITGEEARSAAENYFSVLYGMDAQSVGGSMPDNDFYYVP